jgi:hypothetical protein
MGDTAAVPNFRSGISRVDDYMNADFEVVKALEQ